MAIVFILPKEKQKKFLIGVTMSLILFFVIVYAIIFLPGFISKIQNIPTGVSFNKPNVIIDMSVLDSPEFKSLQPFNAAQTEFTYTVEDKNGKKTTGNISFATQEGAQNILEASGYKVLSLQEVTPGRSEPFVSY